MKKNSGTKVDALVDALREQIFAADGRKCSDPLCPCYRKQTGNRRLDPHHIKLRSLGGTDTLSNRITLCDIAHARAHDGYKRNGEWISGRRYMIELLESYQHSRRFRWNRVLDWLKTCEDRHRIGSKP